MTVGDEKFKRLQPYRGSKQPRVYQSSIADIPNTGMVARNTGLGKSDSGSRGKQGVVGPGAQAAGRFYASSRPRCPLYLSESPTLISYSPRAGSST